VQYTHLAAETAQDRDEHVLLPREVVEVDRAAVASRSA
jgi:hypothetical protein